MAKSDVGAKLWKLTTAGVAITASALAGYFLSFQAATGSMSLTASTKSPDASGKALVEVTRVESRRFSDTVNAIATTRARQSIDVYPSTAGRVIWVGIEPGAAVKQGDLLLKLDDDGQDAVVHQAEASVVETKARYDRTKQLSLNNAIAAAEAEAANAAWLRAQADLELAENNHMDRRVVAAFDGIVGLTNLRIGSRVETATLVTTLDDLSAVEVSFSVPERYFPKVKIGQRVELRTEAFSDRVFEASVSAVDTRIDPVSRVVSLRAMVPNVDRALVGGMLANASLTVSTRDSMTVPSHSVIADGDISHVYVVDAGKAAKTEIRIGATDRDMVEVVAGLEHGDEVVTSGLHQISDGAEVEIKPSAAKDAAE